MLLFSYTPLHITAGMRDIHGWFILKSYKQYRYRIWPSIKQIHNHEKQTLHTTAIPKIVQYQKRTSDVLSNPVPPSSPHLFQPLDTSGNRSTRPSRASRPCTFPSAEAAKESCQSLPAAKLHMLFTSSSSIEFHTLPTLLSLRGCGTPPQSELGLEPIDKLFPFLGSPKCACRNRGHDERSPRDGVHPNLLPKRNSSKSRPPQRLG